MYYLDYIPYMKETLYHYYFIIIARPLRAYEKQQTVEDLLSGM